MISGFVTASMMVLSVLVSLVALRLRQRIGLAAILLLAFGIQIGLIGILALSNATIVIALLVFRMVPNSLSQPFILARIQPLLASTTTDAAQMRYVDMQMILGCYALAGLICFVILAISTGRAAVNEV